MPTFVIAKVLIVNEANEILVIRRSQTDARRPGQWDFPGGWLNEGEDILAAMTREAAEEAHMHIGVPRIIYGLSEATESGSSTWLFGLSRVKDTPAIILSYEHDAYNWVPLDELRTIITHKPQQAAISYVTENEILGE